MYQQGAINLTPGETNYTVTFPDSFITPPSAIFTQIYNIDAPLDTVWLEAVVTSRTNSEFTVTLPVPPPALATGYVLSWLAGTGDISDGGGSGGGGGGVGLPFEGLPTYTPNRLPSSSAFPVVVPGVVSKAYKVSWEKLLSMIGSSHNHTIQQISNATPVGRRLLSAVSATVARNIISAAATTHTHVVDDLFDSTGIGRSLLTSATASTARGVIDAANEVHTHVANDITDATSIGKDVVKAATQAAARTAIGAAPTVHTHLVVDLSDATDLGKDLLTSTDATEARGHIEALSYTGWDGTVSAVGGSINVADAYMSKKILVATATITAVLNPLNVSETFGRVAFDVATGLLVNLSATGGATIATSYGTSLGTSYALRSGFHVLENVGNKWVVNSFTGAFGATLAATETASAAKTALGITVDDITDAGAAGRDVMGAATVYEIRDLLSVPSTNATIVTTTSGATKLMSSITSGNLSNKIIEAGTLSIQTVEIDTIFSTAVGERFTIIADSFPVTITTSGTVRVNEGGAFTVPIVLQPGQLMEFIVFATGSFSDLVTNNEVATAGADIAWVSSSYGSDVTGTAGNSSFPFATIQAAAATNTPLVVVTPGEYTVATPLSYNNPTSFYFYPSSLVTYTGGSGTALFSLTNSNQTCTVKGYGNFVTDGAGSIISATSTGSTALQFEAEAVASSNGPAISLSASSDFINSYIDVKNLFGSISLSNSRTATAPTQVINVNVGTWETTNLLTGSTVSRFPVFVTANTIICDKLRTQAGGLRCSITCTGDITFSNTATGTYSGIATETNDAITIRAINMRMRNSTGPVITHGGGTLKVDNTHIAGKIVMAASGLLLRDCSNETSEAMVGTGGVQNLRVIGSLTTNIAPDSASVDFIGCNVHIDATIFGV